MDTRHVTVKDGDVLVLVGTVKGAFVLRSNAARKRWELGGPYHPGLSVYAMAFDQRGGRKRLWAGPGSEHWGWILSSSDDFGRTWTKPTDAPIKFPVDTGAALKRIWQIQPGHADQTQLMYCGVEPAALFESKDGGKNWSLMRGLWNHPHREKWQPGGGGLGLHTILPDPKGGPRLTVAISTGGVYRSDDRGASWQVKNVGVRADFLPDKHPEFGQCVHKISMHNSNPNRLFLQNHWGLYRSDNGGDSWTDIANGVPSDFGFAVVSHPHDPDTAYIVPLESDQFRCTPDGRLRVYRTRDAGKSWEPLTKGLPQKDAFETVLRDAMDADRLNPAGVYFGTRNGQIWGSSDGGGEWTAIASGLPAVLCVRAAVVGDPARVRVPKSGRAATAKRAVARPKRAIARPKRAAAKPKRAGMKRAPAKAKRSAPAGAARKRK